MLLKLYSNYDAQFFRVKGSRHLNTDWLGFSESLVEVLLLSGLKILRNTALDSKLFKTDKKFTFKFKLDLKIRNWGA